MGVPLPLGDPNNGYKLKIFIYILNGFGCYTAVAPIELVISPPKKADMADALKRLEKGKPSEDAGAQDIGNYVKTFTSVINVEPKKEDENVYDSKKALEQKKSNDIENSEDLEKNKNSEKEEIKGVVDQDEEVSDEIFQEEDEEAIKKREEEQIRKEKEEAARLKKEKEERAAKRTELITMLSNTKPQKPAEFTAVAEALISVTSAPAEEISPDATESASNKVSEMAEMLLKSDNIEPEVKESTCKSILGATDNMLQINEDRSDISDSEQEEEVKEVEEISKNTPDNLKENDQE